MIMDKELLEDVLKYLTPQMKYVMQHILNKKQEELEALRERLNESINSNYVKFSEEGSLDIDFKKQKLTNIIGYTTILLS